MPEKLGVVEVCVRFFVVDYMDLFLSLSWPFLGTCCVLRCGILAIVFASKWFLIPSLISILAGLISFDDVCSLGNFAFGIGLPIVVAWIGVVAFVHRFWSITCGLFLVGV